MIHLDAFDLSDALKDALVKENTVVPISKEFSKLPTNADRIRFCYELLRERNLLPEHLKTEKCDELADAARSKGNEYYCNYNYALALESYNKALACAEMDSKSMSVAYSNRAVIYQHVGLYNFCLENINLALSCDHTMALETKLLSRKSQCLESLKHHHDIFEVMRNPKLQLSYAENPKIPFVVESLEYANSETFGRYVRTKTPLKPGDIVILEEPFFKTLLKESVYAQCTNCGHNNFFNLVPCPRSTMAMFCSEPCATQAWERFYQYEHTIIDGIFDVFTKIPINAIRGTVKAFTMTTNLNELVASIDTDTENAFNVDYTVADECMKFGPIYALATNESSRSVADLFQRANICAIAWYMFKKFTAMSEVFEDCRQKEDLFLELLMRFNQAAAVNYHCISESMRYSEGPDRQLAPFTPRNYGSGAFALCSLINHSCAPNVVRFSVAGTNVIMVVRPIEAGGQLFDNYGPHHCLDSIDARQKVLKDQYRFTCGCEACSNNYKTTDKLPTLNIVPTEILKSLDTLRADMNFNEDTMQIAKTLYKSASKLLAEIDKYYPCIDISRVQEVLFICAHTLFYKKPLDLIFMKRNVKESPRSK